MEKLKALLRSRKFWAALIGLLFIVGQEFVPALANVSQEAVLSAVVLLASFILGTGMEDGLRG